MPRRISLDWSVNDDVTAPRLQNINQEIDDLYTSGNDRGRIVLAASETPLRVDIGAFSWQVGTYAGLYAGGTNVVVTDDATNYIEIDATGTIQINQTGWESNNARLGKVTCASGAITEIEIWKPDVMGGDLRGSNLVNEETLSGDITLEATDKKNQLLDAGGADRDVTLDTVDMSEGSTFNIKNSGGAYSLAIGTLCVLDPGESGVFAYDGAAWKTVVLAKKEVDCGDYSDGDVTISSPTTLTKDMYYKNLIVNSVLTTANFRLFALSISGTGTIVCKGNDASGQTKGAALAAGYFQASLAGVDGGAVQNVGTGAGAAGNPGAAGNATSNSAGGSNGKAGAAGGKGGNGMTSAGSVIAGGAAGAAGAAGTATQISPVIKMRSRINGALGVILNGTSVIQPNLNAGSGGGGAGGNGGGNNSSSGGQGGYGGGSGSNAGFLFAAAKKISGSVSFVFTGGVGGNGRNGTSAEAGTSNRGGGGGGGGGAGSGGAGGRVVIDCPDTEDWTGTVDVSGGDPGTPGTGAAKVAEGTDGDNGAAAEAGPDGIYVLLQ